MKTETYCEPTTPTRPTIKLVLAFPACVQQIDKNTVEIELPVYNGPFFAPNVIDGLAPSLSEAELDKLSEDIIVFAQTEALRRSIRIMLRTL